MTSHPVADLSAASLAAAIEDNLFDFWGLLSGAPALTLEDRPEMIRYRTGVRFPLMNGILRARLSADDRTIEAALGPFRAEKMPMMWWTCPRDTPADLGERLKRAGLLHAEDAPGMAVNLQALDAGLLNVPGLTIEVVQTPADYAAFGHILASAFEMPDFVVDAMVRIMAHVSAGPDAQIVSFLGRLEGKPVATSSLVLARGVAGIYNVATLAEARGRGAGAALTLKPLLYARDRGYHAGILHSSHMGYNVYKRLGFEKYCTISQYVWMGE